MKSSFRGRSRWIIIAIILLGFTLRIYQLGEDSFWNDESGQVYAASQQTLKAMLEISDTHAMAMPLDYLVSMFFTRLGINETVMRFPSVIWSTLTLALIYVFTFKLTSRSVANLTVLLLALSDRHVYYAQEVRFYAALGFFSCLTMLLLHHALVQKAIKYWIAFIIACLLGMYFHPYVILTLSYGFCFLIFKRKSREYQFKSFLTLFICGFILVMLFLPGYIIFGAEQQYDYKIMQFGSDFKIVLLRGLGWSTWPHIDVPPIFSLWELLCLVSFIAGCAFILTLKLYKGHLLLALLVSIFIQVIGIISADVVRNYFFAARQILHLSQYLLIFSAVGIHQIKESIVSRVFTIQSIIAKIVPAVISILVILLATPRLGAYYQYVKGEGRVITQVLQTYHQNQIPIYVIPGYEIRIYRLYLLIDDTSRPEIISHLQPSSFADLPAMIAENTGKQILIAPTLLKQEELDMITTLGFTKLYDSGLQGRHIRILYIKDN